MNLKNLELHAVVNTVDKLSMSPLKVDNIKKMLDLRKELIKCSQETAEVQKAIFESYGIDKSINGIYKYSDHEKHDEIKSKVMELFEQNVTISTTNFLSESEFYESSKNCSLPQIESLRELLLEF